MGIRPFGNASLLIFPAIFPSIEEVKVEGLKENYFLRFRKDS